jgi:molybdate transport system substrate-binding protein
MRARILAAVVVATSVALSTGCSGSSGPSGGQGGGHITVLAASSLTDAFAAEAKAFQERTGTSVTTSFAGSPDLVAQVKEGAPADVIATADTTTIQGIASSLVAPSKVFVHNRLVIVVAKGNPHHITSVADLADAGLTVVLADPSVPAGNYAQQVLSAQHVTVHPASLELDVRSVLTKVQIGEADAGIVYATDAASAAAKVDAIPIRGAPIATYPIGALTDNGQPFVDFVLSAPGERIMQHYGFLPP